MKNKMKRLLYITGIAASVFTLTNCTEELQNQPEGGKIPYSIYVSTGATRTANDGMSTVWTEGDALAVFHSPAGSTDYSRSSMFTLADAQSNRFDTPNLNGGLSASNDWYLLYPYSADINGPENGVITIAKSVSQKGYDSMEHLSGENCPLYGVAKGVSSETLPGLSMGHLTSIVKVQVSNNTDRKLTIESASLIAETDITGSYKVDITGEEVVYVKTGDSKVSNTASVTVEEAKELAAGETAELYIPVKPFTASAGSKLILTVNSENKTLKLDKSVTFHAGKIKTLAFSYDTPEDKNFDFEWKVEEREDCEECNKHQHKPGIGHAPISHDITLRVGVEVNGEPCPWKIEYINVHNKEWIKVPESGTGKQLVSVSLNGNPDAVGRTAFFNIIALNEHGVQIASKRLQRINQYGVHMELERTDNSNDFELTKWLDPSYDCLFYPPYPSSGDFRINCNADDIVITTAPYIDEGFTTEGATPSITKKYDGANGWNCTVSYDSNRNINYADPYDEPWRGSRVYIRPVIRVYDWVDDDIDKGAEDVICLNNTNKEIIDSLETIQFGVDIYAADYAYIACPVAPEDSEVEYHSRAYGYDTQLERQNEYFTMYSNVDCKLCSAGQYAQWDYGIMFNSPGAVESDGYYYSYYTGQLLIEEMLDNWINEKNYSNRPILRNTEVQNGRVEWLYAEAYLRDGREPLKVPFTLIAQYGIPKFYVKEWKSLGIDTFVGHYDFDLSYQIRLGIENPDDNFSEGFIRNNRMYYTYYVDPYEHPGTDPYENWFEASESGLINDSMFGYWGGNYVYHDLRMKYPEGGYVYASEPYINDVTISPDYSVSISSASPAKRSAANSQSISSSVDIRDEAEKYKSRKNSLDKLSGF